MGESSLKILEAALALSERDRAAIAEALLESLGPEDELVNWTGGWLISAKGAIKESTGMRSGTPHDSLQRPPCHPSLPGASRI
jgi:hypothetical protein